ncbi:glycosyltransferase family 2 protein, partial [Oenococcus oeni]
DIFRLTTNDKIDYMRNNIPKVGVVIPTYERPDHSEANGFVLEAIQSVLDQTVPVNDIVVSIDGSSTNIKSLIKNNFKGIKIIESVEKVGGSKARNNGFDSLDVNDQFVAFLDDDDKWYQNKLKEQLNEALKQTDSRYFIFTNVVYDEPDGQKIRPINRISNNESATDFIFLRQGYITTSSLLIPFETFNNIQFKNGLKKHQDWDLIFRSNLINGIRMIQIFEPLVWYRMQYSGRNNSVSSVIDWKFSHNWIIGFNNLISKKVIASFDKDQVLPGLISDHELGILNKIYFYLIVSLDFNFGIFNWYLLKRMFFVLFNHFIGKHLKISDKVKEKNE